MSAAELLDELRAAGLTLEADGERLRFFPRSALGPGQVERLRRHKGGLLKLLRPPPLEAPALEGEPHPVEPLEADPLEADLPERFGDSTNWGPDGWPVDTIEGGAACRGCGSLDQWLPIDGTAWRCSKCHPPAKADRIRRTAERLRARAERAGKQTPTRPANERSAIESARESSPGPMRQASV